MFVGFANKARAIATANQTVSEAAPSGQGYSLNWDYIYNYKNATAVAVDHYWLLTASHVADDGGTGNLTIGGVTYYQKQIVYHATADLALIRYDKPLPGYYLLHEGAIYSGKGPNRTYATLLMVGYGFAGTVSGSSFTQTAGTTGVKRWGTNQGATDSALTADIGGGVQKTTQSFYMPFSSSATSLEAGGNIYDSGGPLFIDDGGVWTLAGLNLYRTGTDPSYTGNYAAFIPNYVSWIKSVISDYDSDMDQLPDWWENLYFPASGTSAQTDSDGDGQDDLHEFYAGTDPNNSADFFDVQSTVTNNAGSLYFLLNFSVTSNRTYVIEESGDLPAGTWNGVTNLTPPSAGDEQFWDPVEAGPNFYRVNIELYQ